MPRSVQHGLPPMEVKPLHNAQKRSEERSPRFETSEIAQAKAGMGAVIREAIGPDKLEAYGHAGLLSGVCSGEKVPEYLATIFANDAAKLRMAKSLLRTCGKRVTERTLFEIDERIA